MQQSQEQKNTENTEQKDKALSEILKKIRESDSILVALSNNPSIDELATAMGLTMYIDALGKHATAIYSGTTPNVLEFLNPEQKFETNTNGLQDFIIAINKDKADHLRYKLDGDYVKVYITPYRTTISESDLEFSHGDYNVNLVIALNVEKTDQLDGALSEHGRIMHDAEIVNIAAGAPGKFGDIQWSDPAASSVAEMVTQLILEMKDDLEIDKEVATALLTGIVAATERFSNNRTQPNTMNIVAKLMTAGADQQLVSENVIKGEGIKALEVERGDEQATVEPVKEEIPVDNTVLDVQAARSENITEQTPATPEVNASVNTAVNIPAPVLPAENSEPALNNTASSEANMNAAQVEMPKVAEVPESQNIVQANPLPPIQTANPVLPQVQATPTADQGPTLNADVMAQVTKMSVPEVKDDMGVGGFEETPNIVMGTDYGKMLDEALKTPEPETNNVEQGGYIGSNPALQAAPNVDGEPDEGQVPKLSFDQPVDMSEDEENPTQRDEYIAEQPMKTLNPIENTSAAVVEPTKTLEERPAGMPLPGEDILPPPPTPPIDFSNVVATGGQVASNTVVEPLVNPVPQNTVAQEQPTDPGAFKIPGM